MIVDVALYQNGHRVDGSAEISDLVDIARRVSKVQAVRLAITGDLTRL